MSRFFQIVALIFLLPVLVLAQNSEELIPHDAVTVFSINNTNLLTKISMDDLVQYEFMEEVQSELFNGSTHGKTIKDAGFDFDQRINAFFGQTHEYDLSGFTFGVSNKADLLKVFTNFDKLESHIPGVEVYRNQLNYLFIQGKAAVVIRIEPEQNLIKEVADSIWLDRGYGFYIPDSEWGIEEWGMSDEIDTDFSELIEVTENEEDFSDEFGDIDQLNRDYWDLRDSVLFEYQQFFIRKISTELFIEKCSLFMDFEDFRKQLYKPVDGVFYLDNSRNITSNKGIWQFQNVFPTLFSDAEYLYTNNVITGEINIVKNEVVVDIHAVYNDELGKIYTSIAKTKFNKNFQKYIYRDALAFFTYNVNLKKAYATSFDVIMDLIQNETDIKVLENVLLAELINEFVDVDNIFNVYQGSMFASLNGYKKIPVTRIDYQYDEETFEYTELAIEENQDIPNLTVGFKTNKNDFLTRIARILAKTRVEIISHGAYYEAKDYVLNSIPVYFAIVDDIVLFSVDENLFTTHLHGYAKSERMNSKEAKKSRFTYIKFDVDKTLSKLPRELLTERQNELIGTLLNKTGVIEFKTKHISKKQAEFKLNYILNENIENNGKYLLDLVNSLYTFTKK